MGYGAALTVVYLAIVVLLTLTQAASRTAGPLFVIARFPDRGSLAGSPGTLF
jgi:hypothetical protein